MTGIQEIDKNDLHIKYLFIEGAVELLQYYWDKINSVQFYNMQYSRGADRTYCVAIWKIKPKNLSL